MWDIRNGTNITAGMIGTICICQNAMKTWNLPVKAGGCDKVEPRKCAGMLNMRTDVHSITKHVNTVRGMQEFVGTRSADLQLLGLPARGAALHMDGPESLESHSDRLRRHMCALSIEVALGISEKMSEMPNLLVRGVELARRPREAGRPNRHVGHTYLCTVCRKQLKNG